MTGRPADHSSRMARGELADPGVAERLEALDSDRYMRRRDFLTRTAMIAGGATLATLLPAERLIREAAIAQAAPLPPPSRVPIDTFVVLMMENRSYDHYFGWREDADGMNAGLVYPDADGDPVKTHRLTPDFQGCDFRDPDHSWDGGRHQWNGGAMDGFVQGNAEGTGSDAFAAGYYLKKDLGFIPHAAAAYSLYDRYFCSIMASTYPNRHYQWSAQSGGQMGNYIPIRELGNKWETIFDRAHANGVSALYFNSDLPFAALYGPRGVSWTRPIAEFYARAATGTLPNICFVDPPFRDGGGGNGTSADEHPHGDVRLGQAFMSDVVHAFIKSPQYRRGAMFINYDEWGGFFEHVEPLLVPDGRSNPDINKSFGLTGFRVPGVVVSPYARRPKGGALRVSHQPVTHESILKLISYRFRLGNLNTRHLNATNIGESFNFDGPRFDRPDLPDPVAIASIPCAVQDIGVGRPKEHDLAQLETSGYLDKLGYKVEKPTFDRIFSAPDSVGKALRDSTG